MYDLKVSATLAFRQRQSFEKRTGDKIIYVPQIWLTRTMLNSTSKRCNSLNLL